jgi:hypothetical protein
MSEHTQNGSVYCCYEAGDGLPPSAGVGGVTSCSQVAVAAVARELVASSGTP